MSTAGNRTLMHESFRTMKDTEYWYWLLMYIRCSSNVMLYDGLYRRCNCFVCVLVFPEDSLAGRVVEGERGTLGSRSQRHAGWWSKKAPKLSFPSDYTPYILFLIIINTAMVLIASSGPVKAPQIVPSFIQTSVTSYMPIAQPLSGLTRYKRSSHTKLYEHIIAPCPFYPINPPDCFYCYQFSVLNYCFELLFSTLF